MTSIQSNPSGNILPSLTPPSQLRLLQQSQPQVSGGQPVSSPLASPDQLRQQLQGQSLPSLHLFTGGTPTTPPAQQPGTGLGQQLSKLQTLMQSADTNALAPYAVQIQKDASGKISGYLLNGQPATPAQIQQHLLPIATNLHQELLRTKSQVDQEFSGFVQTVNSQFARLAPAEQNSVRIQLQAIQVVYRNFVERLNQVDELIK